MNYCHNLIYTDLDATFLDSASYSCQESLPALRAAQSVGIDVVFCSSKTSAEINELIRELGFSAPFIAENGGGIYLPKNYLGLILSEFTLIEDDYVLILGQPYDELIMALREVRAELGLQMRGFSDMTEEEVAELCDMNAAKAALAKQRHFDEPFIVQLEDGETERRMREAFSERGLRVTRGGRFFHVTGRNDKGLAVRNLNRLYLRQYHEIFTFGIGDSVNDLSMLAAVDQPALVKKPDGSYDSTILLKLPQVLKIPGIGPVGWAQAVMDIVGDESGRKA